MQSEPQSDPPPSAASGPTDVEIEAAGKTNTVHRFDHTEEWEACKHPNCILARAILRLRDEHDQAGVAQSVERGPRKSEAAGSSPAPGSPPPACVHDEWREELDGWSCGTHAGGLIARSDREHRCDEYGAIASPPPQPVDVEALAISTEQEQLAQLDERDDPNVEDPGSSPGLLTNPPAKAAPEQGIGKSAGGGDPEACPHASAPGSAAGPPLMSGYSAGVAALRIIATILGPDPKPGARHSVSTGVLRQLEARVRALGRERDEARRQVRASMQIRREEGASLDREILADRAAREQATKERDDAILGARLDAKDAKGMREAVEEMTVSHARNIQRLEEAELDAKARAEKAEGPRCSACKGPHELNYYVDDAVWEKIRPEKDAPPGGGGALCLNCIDARCAKAGMSNVQVRVHFQGEVVALAAFSAAERDVALSGEGVGDADPR